MKLHILPIQGFTSPSEDFGQYVYKAILPVFCLSLPLIASITRQTRTNMLEVINQDYAVSYTHLGDRVQEGDVILLDSPHKLPPFTPATNGPDDHRLVVGEDSAKWFAAKKVKCVGFGDGVSIEDSQENVKPFHDILMAQNIVFLEVLKNLRCV